MTINNILRYLLIVAVFFLAGCFSLFDSGEDTIIGQYNISWVDDHANRSIHKAIDDGGGDEELIHSYVYAVGHNDRFIIAKQHAILSLDNPVDTRETNYYIIDMALNPEPGKTKGLYGPLYETRFNDLCNKLHIGEIKFDMFYPEQP